MKLIFLLAILTLTSACNLNNPVYSIVLSWDAYRHPSHFINSYNPLVGKKQEAPFFDLIQDTEKCFILLEENLSTSEPKINVYSVRQTEDAAPFAVLIVTRGTYLDPDDVYNDNQIRIGEIPNYVYNAVNLLTAKIPLYAEKQVIFIGHSLGAFVSHSLGFLFNKPSFGFESPGTVMQASKLEELAGDGRKYIEYHNNQTRSITGIPNVINYYVERAEYRHTVLFIPPLESCFNFVNFIARKRFSFMRIMETPSWIWHYHSSNVAIDTLIIRKDKINKTIVDDVQFHLLPVLSNELLDEQFKIIHECVVSHTGAKITVEELRAEMLAEIEDPWVNKIVK